MGLWNGVLLCLVVEGPCSGKTASGSQTVSDTVQTHILDPCGSRTVAKVQQGHLPCVSGIVVLRASIVHHVLLPAVREDTPLCMWKRGC